LHDKKKFRDAEKLYLAVGKSDLAIAMYKSARAYGDMIRLVEKFHPEFLKQTHAAIGKICEDAEHLSQAEQHYVAGNDVRSAIQMFISRKMWEDAYRVAKLSNDSGVYLMFQYPNRLSVILNSHLFFYCSDN
jgi:intraflagellar transport protein 172